MIFVRNETIKMYHQHVGIKLRHKTTLQVD